MLKKAGKEIAKALKVTLLVVNVLCILCMWACATSQLVPPQEHARLSLLGLIFPVFLIATAVFVPIWLVVRWRWVWVPVAGMLLCAGSIRTFFPLNWPQEAPEGSIRVLTFNTYNLPVPAGEQMTDFPSFRYILESGADIVCCQEAPRLERGKADSLLATVYPYRSYPTSHTASFALLSKFPILSEEPIAYESNTNSSFAYRLLVGEDTVLLLNNHFESYHLQPSDREDYKDLILGTGEKEMEMSLRSLAAKALYANVIRGPQADSVAAYVQRAPERYIILCGDFNDPTISYTHYRLTRLLNDAYTRSGNGPGISYHMSGMYFRIDNILCSPSIKAYGARVDRSITSSDHYPLTCQLVLSP